jgi:hypothetical protein
MQLTDRCARRVEPVGRLTTFHKSLRCGHDFALNGRYIAYMARTFGRLSLWIPRILGFGLCVFIGLFALDAFAGGASGEAVLAFAIHLIPALALLVLVALSWRREWIGGIGFVALAAAYAASVGRGHPDWVLVISGPLFMVGLSYFWTWRHRAKPPRVGDNPASPA